MFKEMFTKMILEAKEIYETKGPFTIMVYSDAPWVIESIDKIVRSKIDIKFSTEGTSADFLYFKEIDASYKMAKVIFNSIKKEIAASNKNANTKMSKKNFIMSLLDSDSAILLSTDTSRHTPKDKTHKVV